MMQSMTAGMKTRGAVGGGGTGEDMFKSLLTEEMAKQVSKAGGIGVAAADPEGNAEDARPEGVDPWPSTAVDCDDRVEQLIILTERLTDLIAKAVAAFEARRPHEAAQYVDEVAKLANLYRHESTRVRANVALVSGASCSAASAWCAPPRPSTPSWPAKGRAVTAAKTVTEGLVRAIAQEVAEQRAPPPPATALAAGRGLPPAERHGDHAEPR
jgi:hypothetical protein